MDILDQEILLNEKDLLITIWTNPKLTFDFILKYCPKKYVATLLTLGGITNAIDRNYDRLFGHNNISIIMLIMLIVFGGIFGWRGQLSIYRV